MGRDLSESDRRILQRLIDRERGRPLNLGKVGVESNLPLGPATEVYVARPVSSEGISGRTDPIGTAVTDPILGQGECDIFQSLYIDGEWVLRQVGEKSQMVFNHLRSGISKDYFLVTKDKFGKWYPVNNFQSVQVRLLADLVPAVNSMTSPTTTTAMVLFRNHYGNLEDSGIEITITNRFETLFVVSGKYGTVKTQDGEWHPDTFDCNE